MKIDGLVRRANCGAWPASDKVVVASEGAAVGGELTTAEEFTGFHKLWDLEARRSLPEKIKEACRKALRGDL